MCILDVLRHLPHTLFSDAQMEMFGVKNLPSEAVVKYIDEVLQMSCGIDTIWYKGPFGHPYYTNHLSSIIVQVCGQCVVCGGFVNHIYNNWKWRTLESAPIFGRCW
jgi:hypothetical protein